MGPGWFHAVSCGITFPKSQCLVCVHLSLKSLLHFSLFTMPWTHPLATRTFQASFWPHEDSKLAPSWGVSNPAMRSSETSWCTRITVMPKSLDQKNKNVGYTIWYNRNRIKYWIAYCFLSNNNCFDFNFFWMIRKANIHPYYSQLNVHATGQHQLKTQICAKCLVDHDRVVRLSHCHSLLDKNTCYYLGKREIWW